MTKLNTAVDTGYGYAIGVSKLGKCCLPNYVKKVSEIEAEEIKKNISEFNEDNILLKYQNEYYVYGRLCMDEFLDTDRKMSIKDRIGNIYHEVELLCTLAFLCPNNNDFSINLSIGVPIKLKDQKDKVIEWLQKTFEFSMLTAKAEIHKSIKVDNVEVLEQPLAPIYCLPANARTGLMVSIDIGHGTFDAVLVLNGKIVTQTGSLADGEGMRRVYEKLRFLLLHRFNRDPYNISEFSDREIQRILETQKMFVHNENMEEVDIDITKELEIALDEYTDYIHTKIDNHYGVQIPKVKAFMATGGILNNDNFKTNLSTIFKNSYNKPLYLTTKPQWNVALGLYNYVCEKHTDDFSKPLQSQNQLTEKEVAITEKDV